MSTNTQKLARERLLKEGIKKAERICEILLECRNRHEIALKKQRKAA